MHMLMADKLCGTTYSSPPCRHNAEPIVLACYENC